MPQKKETKEKTRNKSKNNNSEEKERKENKYLLSQYARTAMQSQNMSMQETQRTTYNPKTHHKHEHKKKKTQHTFLASQPFFAFLSELATANIFEKQR